MNIQRYAYIIYLAAGALAFLLLAWLFADILLYFVISLVIASLLLPVTDYISSIYFFQMKIPRVAAVIFSFALLISVISLFVLLFIPLISEQVRILSNIDLDDIISRFNEPLKTAEDFVIGVLKLSRKPGFISEALRNNLLSFMDQLELRSVINFTIQFSAAFSVTLLAVVFITFFLLYEKGILRRNLIQLIPNKYFELTITTLHKIEKLLSYYLLGLFLQIFSIFSLTALGLTLIGVNYALTIAIFAALVNVVPYIGPVVGSTFGVIVGISVTSVPDGADTFFWLIAKILLIFVGVHLIDNLISQPLIFSKSVKAHPLEIFVAIFAGAAIAGPVGMIAAIPVYTVIRVSTIEFNRGYKQYHVFRMYRK